MATMTNTPPTHCIPVNTSPRKRVKISTATTGRRVAINELRARADHLDAKAHRQDRYERGEDAQVSQEQPTDQRCWRSEAIYGDQAQAHQHSL
ncbi:MAG: hypothetical protein SVR81_00555 [Chloroflexota bacterium]|nr:hypothetical protein [Chloroflexota bacterium]